MTLYMRNAAEYLINPRMFSTTDSVTFASVQEAMYVNSWIAIKHFSTASGLIAQANKISFSHLCSPLYNA